MRLSRKRNFRSWTPETSRLAHEAKALKRLAATDDQIPRPQEGMLIKIIRVTDELEGRSFEIKLLQASRINQVIAETFWRKSKPIGVDRVMRRLRERCVTRWIH